MLAHVNWRVIDIGFVVVFDVVLSFSVIVKVKSRRVTVTGSRGTLVRSFRHLPVNMQMVGKKTLKVDKWFGKHKELAATKTVCSHVENMIKGVTKVIGLVWSGISPGSFL